MFLTKLKTAASMLAACLAFTGTGFLMNQALAEKPKLASPATAAEGKGKPGDSPALAETEAKLAKLRELIRPQPGEHVTNMAKIAWERDPWVAAVKAGKEGKPVLVYAEGAAGIACGYG